MCFGNNNDLDFRISILSDSGLTASNTYPVLSSQASKTHSTTEQTRLASWGFPMTALMRTKHLELNFVLRTFDWHESEVDGRLCNSIPSSLVWRSNKSQSFHRVELGEAPICYLLSLERKMAWRKVYTYHDQWIIVWLMTRFIEDLRHCIPHNFALTKDSLYSELTKAMGSHSVIYWSLHVLHHLEAVGNCFMEKPVEDLLMVPVSTYILQCTQCKLSTICSWTNSQHFSWLEYKEYNNA